MIPSADAGDLALWSRGIFLPLRLAKSNLLLKLESAGWNDRIKLFVFARISNDISYVEEILDKIGYSFLASAIMNKNVITIC